MLLLQVKSNGAVPWVINAVMLPWLPEPQEVEYKEKSTGGVEVIENGVEIEHPSASVTVNRCCPTLTLVYVTVSWFEPTILFVPSIE